MEGGPQQGGVGSWLSSVGPSLKCSPVQALSVAHPDRAAGQGGVSGHLLPPAAAAPSFLEAATTLLWWLCLAAIAIPPRGRKPLQEACGVWVWAGCQAKGYSLPSETFGHSPL